MKELKLATLFSGIEAFGFAAEMLGGFELVFSCELNQYCQTLLKYYWPKATHFTNIDNTDFKDYANKIDILAGGFPCQPYSQAGSRKGSNDKRDKWPQMRAAIRIIKPRWIITENVPGLVTWEKGLVFDKVQTDLENEGYKVQAFIVPAASKNAPHRRQRLFIVAYSPGYGYKD